MNKLADGLAKARQKLKEMQSAGNNAFSSEKIAQQKDIVDVLQKKYNTLKRQVEQYDKQIKDANVELDYAKDLAGKLELSLSQSTGDRLRNIAVSLREGLAKTFSSVGRISKDVLATMGRFAANIGKQILQVAQRLDVSSKISRRLQGTFKRLGELVKGAFIFNVISRGLRVLQENIVQYLTVNTEFTSALSQVKARY